jgi:hypothetical protein
MSPIATTLASLTLLPNVAGLSNNYYAAGPFNFNRYTGDGKINWNPGPKLSAFVRMSVLRYNSYNQQMFGPLGGPPTLSGSNPGNGDGGTYSGTVAVTYLVSPTFVIDAYYGYTRADTSSAQPRLNEKLGLDLLHIPGTNGTRLFEGGWPRFEVNSFTNIGINEEYMPYYRRDPSYHYVANFNWTHGSHDVRFGLDINPRGVNQAQAQFVGTAPNGSTFEGAQGGFTFSGGPTSIPGGPSPNQYNNYAAFLLGLTTRVGRTLQVSDEYGLRMHLYSFYVRDRWAATRKLTIDYGLRWEYFPLMTRTDHGLERYDPGTDKMLICGVGVIPTDCGVSVSKRMFAPRLGLAYRATKTLVLRAGYGITNDPFQGAELMRGNFPVLVPLDIESSNSFVAVGTLAQGIPQIQTPNLGNGIIDIGKNYPVNSVQKSLGRGYLQSWNATVQKELRYNFTAQIAYVATREVRQFGYLNINAGQVIGAGTDGQPLLQQYGRTAAVTMLTPLGSGHYDSLQSSLERRLSRGLQVAAHYTFSKAIGLLDNNDSSPPVADIRYFSRNRTLRNFDRTHNLQITNIWELPFGKGKPWVNRGGIASALLGGWQLNDLWSFMSGLPFTVTASGASLNLPGSTQTADQVNPTVAKLGGVGPGQSFFDPFAFTQVTQARFGTAGFNILRGPGIVNCDFGLFREFAVRERWRIQFRAEAFNFTNTPHFSNPGANVSNLVLNPNGTIKDLGGFTQVTGVYSPAREGIDERQIRFGLRISW